MWNITLQEDRGSESNEKWKKGTYTTAYNSHVDYYIASTDAGGKQGKTE